MLKLFARKPQETLPSTEYPLSLMEAIRQRVANVICPRLPTYRTLEAECARLSATLAAQQQEAFHATTFNFQCHRPIENTAGRYALSQVQQKPDDALVDRIVSSYRAAMTTEIGSAESFWTHDEGFKKKTEHETLMTGDFEAVKALLSNPAGNTLFLGFDILTIAAADHGEEWSEWQRRWVYDNLVRLCEAVGTKRLHHPESPPRTEAIEDETEQLLESLDAAFAFTVNFPNPFPTELGLYTSRGVASYRAIQALYQAWRVSSLVRDRQASILEIGGGLGRTAYYANKFGLDNYAMVDLPMTCVAQGYFLGATLGADAVSLYRESRQDGQIAIYPPEQFFKRDDHFDFVINVDSLTEMARQTAADYLNALRKRTPLFLSINHEANSETVSKLARALDLSPASRVPYWMRRGYVEELFCF